MPLRYELLDDYGSNDGVINSAPAWGIGVIPLARPVTYNRKEKRSMGEIIMAVELRQDPFFIKKECLGLSVHGNKRSHTKTLSATLKGDTNFLSVNGILPGDWVMAWCMTNQDDLDEIEKRFKNREKINYFSSGFKFMGRAHSISKSIVKMADGKLSSSYSLQGIGFGELDSVFYYNPQLATAEIAYGPFEAMSQIGLNWLKWTGQIHENAGTFLDNGEDLIYAFMDIVVGASVPPDANKPTDNWRKGIGGSVEGGVFSADARNADITPHSNEAPYSYLVPSVVGKYLGVSALDPNKGARRGHTAMGYADIVTLLTGVQRYENTLGILPELEGLDLDPNDPKNSQWATRLKCKERLKGTYIPATELTLISQPLWSTLQTFINPAINEIYTAMKPGLSGDIVPMIVARQIPFSTDVIEENPRFPLTRISSMPRWVVDSSMVNSLDVGRSNSTRFNYVQVFGSITNFPSDKLNSPVEQLGAGNVPIADYIDIARSGFHPYMNTVQCAPYDLTREGQLSPWIEAIADWSIDSQYTLNGTLSCSGIQSPIAEGDFIEFENVIYHIEGLVHNCSIGPNGERHFTTTMSLSKGMPVDQGQDQQIPRFPGFAKDTKIIATGNNEQQDRLSNVLGVDVSTLSDTYSEETQGDDTLLTSLDPGRTVE